MSSALTDQFLNPAGAARLLMAAGASGGGLSAFIRLALAAGARRAELLDVCWPDLEWPTERGESGTLLIACREGGKALAGREVALDPVTMRLLANWRDVRRSMLAAFGAKLDDQGVVFAFGSPVRASRQVHNLASQMGVSVDITALRRYSMTRLVALGV